MGYGGKFIDGCDGRDEFARNSGSVERKKKPGNRARDFACLDVIWKIQVFQSRVQSPYFVILGGIESQMTQKPIRGSFLVRYS